MMELCVLFLALYIPLAHLMISLDLLKIKHAIENRK